MNHEASHHAARTHRPRCRRRQEGPGVLSLTLLCSDAAFDRDGAEWRTIAQDLQSVVLRGADAVSQPDLAGVDIAFFSGDIWPLRAARFMRVALDAPNLRWMHLANAGTDHPVFAMLRDRGVRLTTSSGAAAGPIAHTVVMHLLAMCRHTRLFSIAQARHQWHAADVEDIEGRVLGIVGLGAIGAEVARLAHHFDMRVIGVRRAPRGDEPCETWPASQLEELLAVVDDLVLTAPLTDETRGMIGATQLDALRTGAHLVNVGRGELIDEAALIARLRSGHIGAAALDVFMVEPLPDDSPLWDMPNVIVTPHSAGSTTLARHRAAEMFAANLARYVQGDALINEVR